MANDYTSAGKILFGAFDLFNKNEVPVKAVF